MPFSVISRLRSAATRVTVSLRGIRFGVGPPRSVGFRRRLGRGRFRLAPPGRRPVPSGS